MSGSKFWVKVLYDNVGSAGEKKRETTGISYKNTGVFLKFSSLYRRFLKK